MENAPLAILCPRCRYDLRYTPGQVCPECGRTIDEDTRLGRSTIPWEVARRGGRGRAQRFIAFWCTVGWSLRYPLRLARQGGRDIDYRSARRFQLWSTLAGAFSAGTFLFMVYYEDVRATVHTRTTLILSLRGNVPDAALGDRVIEWSIGLAAAAAGWLWLLLASSVPSYFFHPRHLYRPLQERGIALSYYASGPLAVFGVVGALWRMALASQAAEDFLNHAPSWANAIVGLLLLATLGFPLLMAWFMPAILLVHGAGQSLGRAAVMLFTTALTWILLLPICLVLPLAVFYGFYVYYLLSY